MQWQLLVVAIFVSLIVSTSSRADGPLPDFLARATTMEDWLVSTRRELHQFPELMYEVRT